MNTQFDQFAYSNRLRHLPPSQKLWFALTSLVIALCSHPPVQIAIAMWLTIWIVRYAAIPVRFYGQIIKSIILFLLTSLTALIFNIIPVDQIHSLSSDYLWGVRMFDWQLYLSAQGLQQALEIFCRSLASISCLFFIILTIPFIELCSTFSQIGCPVILTEIMLLCYRFIFLLAEVAQKISIAQISRGGYRTHKLAINSLSLLIRQLLQRTVERYNQLSLGIKARGFNHEFRFWQPQSYQYSPRYGVEAIAGCTGLISWEILQQIYG